MYLVAHPTEKLQKPNTAASSSMRSKLGPISQILFPPRQTLLGGGQSQQLFRNPSTSKLEKYKGRLFNIM